MTFSILSAIQWLFRSRYVAELEAENERLRMRIAERDEQLAQITSNLLVGAGMPGIVRQSESVPTKGRTAPSQWRRAQEWNSRNSKQEAS